MAPLLSHANLSRIKMWLMISNSTKMSNTITGLRDGCFTQNHNLHTRPIWRLRLNHQFLYLFSIQNKKSLFRDPCPVYPPIIPKQGPWVSEITYLEKSEMRTGFTSGFIITQNGKKNEKSLAKLYWHFSHSTSFNLLGKSTQKLLEMFCLLTVKWSTLKWWKSSSLMFCPPVEMSNMPVTRDVTLVYFIKPCNSAFTWVIQCVTVMW